MDELKQRSAALRPKLDGLARDLESLASGDAEAIGSADAVRNEVKEWRDLCERLIPRVLEYLARLERRRDEQIETFDERLSHVLRSHGHAVYGETALLIVNGIVHVETSPRKAIGKVNGVQVAELSTRAIAERVGEEMERIHALLTAPEEMLDQLLQAYEREVRASGSQFGTQVNVSAVLLQVALLRQRPAFGQNPIAANYRGYARDLFRADLYTLLAAGKQMVRGKRFQYASGSDTAGAIFMLVPALGRAAHVGRIWFAEAE